MKPLGESARISILKDRFLSSMIWVRTVMEKEKTKQELLVEIEQLKAKVNLLNDQLHAYNLQSEKDIEHRMAVTISQIPLAILNLDRHGYITAANPAFLKTFDVHANDIINRMNINNFPSFQGTLLIDKLHQLIEQNREFDIEVPFQFNSEKDIYFRCKGTTVPSKMTDALSFILIIGDVSKRKMTEYELIKALEKAEESDKLKTAFLTSMSHEIRTPMNHIIGFVDFLRDPQLPSEDREQYSQIVFDSGQVLLRLIDDIIDIAKIEAGQMRINSKNFILDDIILAIYRSFNQLKAKRGKENIAFNLERPEKMGRIIIHSDAIRLQQIVNNLLENAFKFTEKGSVTLGYQIVGNKDLVIFVKDSGPGISKDMHSLIFKRFRQLDYSTTKKHGGTGLGLSIIKGLAELLGADIELISELGAGSTFLVKLPDIVVQVESVTPFVADEVKRKFDWSGKTFLVVEDEQTNYNLLMVMLRPSKARLIWARDGQEAIEIMQRSRQEIDLVLMDIRLPRVNGYEATKAIKIIDKSVPVIAQTAYAMDVEVKLAMEAGCDAYLTKPIDRSVLLTRIAELLEE